MGSKKSEKSLGPMSVPVSVDILINEKILDLGLARLQRQQR